MFNFEDKQYYINPWKTFSSSQVYDNPWISVYDEKVRTPEGKDGQYGIVHFKNIAVGILPIDRQGNTWLVGQYRYTLDKFSWEIPEGGCPLNTDPEQTALRELKEETGLIAGNIELILDMSMSNCVSDELALVYLATDLTQGMATPEPTEKLEIHKLPVSEAIEWVMEGRIQDAISIAALLKYQVLINKKS